MRRIARVDRNQPEIVEALRRAGAHVLLTHQLKNCFDILVFFNGETYCMEIKDGELTPSRKRLTEGEEKFKQSIEARGCTYFVVENKKEALSIIGITLKT